jgi:DNA-binding transcriptional regulator YiaG
VAKVRLRSGEVEVEVENHKDKIAEDLRVHLQSNIKEMVEYRKTNNLNQVVFAKRFNSSQSTISKWEKGILEPSASQWSLFQFMKKQGPYSDGLDEVATKAKDEIEVVFWSCNEDVEILYFQDMDEAIEHHLEDLCEEITPELEIEVYGFARVKVKKEWFKRIILEHAKDFFSEDYDGEDGHEQGPAIQQAAEEFVKKYLENYTPWRCCQVKTEKINAYEWCKKHRSDLLEVNKESKC